MTKSEVYQIRAANHLRKHYDFIEKSLVALLAERGLSRTVLQPEKLKNGYSFTEDYDKNGNTIFVPVGVVKVYTILQLVEFINQQLPDGCRLAGKDLLRK